jgi:branched-chain amino acid transport system substrate-binding protein
MRRAVGVALVCCAALAPGAAGKTLHVYSSMPLQGANATQARDIVRAIRLALKEAGGRAGRFDIAYTSLDNSTRAAGNWDPGRCAENATRARRDPATILFIGAFNSGCSAIMLPILNRSNIPQISPTNTYAGLTARVKGTCCREPGRYSPTGKRTFVRLIPDDRVQGAALATLMRDDGCTKVGLANDKDTYGFTVAEQVHAAARRLGLSITRDYGIDTTAEHYRGLARSFKRAGADCFIFSGVTANHAPRVYRDVHAALPTARLYGPDGVCESGLTKHVSPDIRSLFWCSIPTLRVEEYPGGTAFLASFAAMFNQRRADPYSIYGYEAMKLGLDSIAGLGAAGGKRESLRKALFAVRDRQSVRGTYSIVPSGDTTLRDFGVYRASGAGNVVYDRRIVAG